MDFAESRVLLLGIVVLGLLEAFYKHEVPNWIHKKTRFYINLICFVPSSERCY